MEEALVQRADIAAVDHVTGKEGNQLKEQRAFHQTVRDQRIDLHFINY
jgi:hypothetical protein